MKSTADCKNFLVEFLKETPDLIVNIYDKEDGTIVYSYALNVKNWKREYKCKPSSENSHIQRGNTDVWTKGESYPRGPHYHQGTPLDTSSIAVERHFILKEDILGTGVRFMVLETHDGELFLGEYIGD